MWPKYIYVSLNFAWTVWKLQYIYLQSWICSTIPILRQSVLTYKIHSYLQNSKSTFFLIYHIDYRRHIISPVLIQSSLQITQHFHISPHAFPSHRYKSTVMQYHALRHTIYIHPHSGTGYSTDHGYWTHHDFLAMYLLCVFCHVSVRQKYYIDS